MALLVRLTAVTAVCMLAAAGVPASAQQAFQFGLIGDMPYTKVQEREYTNVLSALNKADLAFVIHVGDFQFDARPYNQDPARASMPCVDESYKAVLQSFQGVRHPVVVTPGDNDWTDCWPLEAQKVDPLDALAKIRATFYPDGKSLGQRTMLVESQAAEPQFTKFRENLRWSIGGITFATVHIVGSNDNFGRTPEMDAEQRERQAANIAWIKTAFARARSDNSRGLVLMTQANPGFENYWPPNAKGRYFGPFFGRGAPPAKPESAFDGYIATLQDELEAFDKPVAYLHGDTHLFRIDKPLYSKVTNRLFENFTRVETFGWPDSHWVLATVDPNNPDLFRFEPKIVADNIVNRKAK
jgi:hypothetical protein